MRLAGPSRKRLAAEVIQTSAMDCGPASLKCLLEGFGIRASYGRLREACQTGLDGTSIDNLEDAAVALGLQAEQVMVPLDHVLRPEAQCLPAIAVTRLPNGLTHFVVVWRRHGSLIQLMDPGSGRRWIASSALLEQLYEHAMPVPAEDWREWAGSEEFCGTLSGRLADLGVGRRLRRSLLAKALENPSWQGLAALDAATRMLCSLSRAGGLSRLGRLLEELIADARTSVPKEYWSVRALPDSPDELILRGAVLVRVTGKRARPPEEELPAELAAALKAPRSRPWRTLAGLLKGDGWLVWLAGFGMLAAAAGVLVEALLFKGLLDIGRSLGLFSQRLAALGILCLLVLALLLLQLPISSILLALGRRLETRFRVAFLRKIPRLGDRYFSSRLTSDMTERGHAVSALRQLPALAQGFSAAGFALVFTALGVVWLDPELWVLTALTALVSVVLPMGTQKLLAERDLRVRSHIGALSRFYLDALLGLVPIRSHGAGPAVRREHEGLLADWTRASLRLQRAAVGLEGLQSLLGFGFSAWLLIDHLLRQGVGGGTLLLVYWVLNLPSHGASLALAIRQLPGLKNICLRLLEPLGAPEPAEEALVAERGLDRPEPQGPAAVALRGVAVQASGHSILEDIDLELKPGSHVAIVGPSGAGKSSLAGVLLGWHKPVRGTVEVDGKPLDAASIDALRRATAWVDPSVQLWNRSLAANLRYGLDAQAALPVGQALNAANLRKLLEKLPEGLQTSLGEGGALVSGGEGQRVRLGRAMLRPGVRLVILDEPFRGLDRTQRGQLIERARALWSAATLICISHDVHETRDFDEVVVLEKGRLVERGTPAALQARPSSRYKDLLKAEKQVWREHWRDGRWKALWLEEGQLHVRNQPQPAAGGTDGAL